MLNDLICKKREELDKSITDGLDYSETYRISVELDELIAQYYRQSKAIRERNKSKKNIYT